MEKKECIWDVAPEGRHCEYCLYDCIERRKKGPVRKDAGEFYQKCRSAMLSLTGIDIAVRTRARPVVCCRNLVIYRMYQEGISANEIAKCVGLDRCTVIYARKSVDFMLSHRSMYLRENEIYSNFVKII